MRWIDYLGWSSQQLNDLRYIGYLYLSEGKYEKATCYFEALTVFDPNNLSDLQTLGALYLETGKGLEALNYLNIALQVQPNDQITLINKAKALFNLGYKKQAIALAKTLQLSDNTKVKGQADALVLAYT